MQRSQKHQPIQSPEQAQRKAPMPLDPKDLQRVAGGLPRGGGWETQQLPRGGGWEVQ